MLRCTTLLLLTAALSACEADTTGLPESGDLVPRTFVIDHLRVIRPTPAPHLGTLEELNARVRLGLLAGEGLQGLAIGTFERDDPASPHAQLFTVADADDPAFPADNFRVPNGETGCCDFEVEATTGMFGHWRISMVADSFSSIVPDFSASFLPLAVPPAPLLFGPIDGTSISGRLAGGGIEEGRLTGVLPASAHELFSGPLDRDVDGDGLESIADTDLDGRIDVCYDAIGARLEPVRPEDPASCVDHLQDGVAIELEFTAVPAHFSNFGR